MSDLIVVNNLKATDVFNPNKVDQVLAKIKEEVSKFKPDMTTPKGRKEIASMAYKVSQSKTYLDKLGKELGEDARKQIETINEERRKIVKELDQLRDEVRKPLDDWEQKEKERVENHQREISIIEQKGKSIEIGYLSLALEEMESNLEIINSISRDFEEFQEKANETILIAKLRIESAITKRKEHDYQQAELARVKAEAEEKARKEREEIIAREAAAKAKKDAEEKAAREKAEIEQKAKEQAEKARLEADRLEQEKLREKARAEAAEAARIRAEEKAKEDAIRAENEKKLAVAREAKRLADEASAKLAAEKAEIEKREANKKHVAKINNEAANAFYSSLNIDQSLAKEIVILIAKGLVPNVKINY